jgi:SMC interacting uncharacterized protein involved in chromosome segregation
MSQRSNPATSYAARLAQSKEVKEAAAQVRAVKQKKHEFGNKIFDLESSIERKQDEIEILKGSADLNVDNIVAAQTRINDLRTQLSALQELRTELFPA